jgi:hypothetical protein
VIQETRGKAAQSHKLHLLCYFICCTGQPSCNVRGDQDQDEVRNFTWVPTSPVMFLKNQNKCENLHEEHIATILNKDRTPQGGVRKG